MSRFAPIARVAIFGFVLLLGLPATVSFARVRRFALLAGANLGGSERVPLRYANADAEAMRAVLQQLGGVAPADGLLVLNSDRAGLLAALEHLRQRLRAAEAPGLRREVVLYYSGHSDERGLLLSGDHLPYRDLRRALNGLPAEVRVAVLDSCASGALTRVKGGRRRAPFLVDTSTDVRGLAILTSSSASETSQESDHVGASFFTHYLVSGLRGAADQDADRRVTLAEAYRFAFHETLARTEHTRGGAQHPAYDFQLVGTGDLVMTDLRSTAAGLTLTEGVGGRVWVRDAEGRLVVELRKVEGRAMELGLQPGRYSVRVERDGALAQTQVQLAAGGPAVVAPDGLSPAGTEAAGPKGAVAAQAGPEPAPAVTPEPERRDYRVVPLDLELMAPIGFGGPPQPPTLTLFSLFLLSGRTTRLHGVGLGVGVGVVEEDLRGLQAAVAANLTGGDARGLQAAVGASLAGGSLTGVQAAVGASMAGGAVSGIQTATGLAFAGGPLRGLQAATGASIATSGGVGVQLAVGAAIASGGEGFRGVQAAAGGTAAFGPSKALQVSSGVNLADDLRGAQVGLVNWADALSGAQIGLVNASYRMSGFQLGLVNVASELDGAPLGLINVIGDGLLDPTVWVEDTGQVHVGIKMGTPMLYTLAHAGIEMQFENPTVAWGLGLGHRSGLGERLHLDTELLARQVLPDGRWPDDLHMHYQLRFSVGFKLAEHLRVVGGPSVNVLVSGERGADDETIAPYSVLHDGDPLVHLWPGLHVGVEF